MWCPTANIWTVVHQNEWMRVWTRAACKSHKQLKLTYVEPRITVSSWNASSPFIHSQNRLSLLSTHTVSYTPTHLKACSSEHFNSFRFFLSLGCFKNCWENRMDAKWREEKIWVLNKLFDDKFCQMEIYFLQLFRQPRAQTTDMHTHYTRAH